MTLALQRLSRKAVVKFKLDVKRFITMSKHLNVKRFKNSYMEIERKPWDAYWNEMTKDKVWVDSWFVQATAWYLNLDLWIVDCQSRDDYPFIRTSGNLEDPDNPCTGPIITIGTKANCHYQSLLPIEMLHMSSRVNETQNNSVAADKKQRCIEPTQKLCGRRNHPNIIADNVKENPPEEKERSIEYNEDTAETNISKKNNIVYSLERRKECQGLDKNEPFIYEGDGEQIVFQKISPDYTMKCPKCQLETRLIIGHVVKDPKCRNFFNAQKFKEQYKKYKEQKIEQENRKRKAEVNEMLRTKKECQELDSNRPFIYKLDGEQIVFQKMSPDYMMKCPKCQIETRLIIGHVVKNPKCRNFFNVENSKISTKNTKS